MRIKEFSKEIRPDEKCIKYGPNALSDEELLAVIIRSGCEGENSITLARRILSLNNENNGIINIVNSSINDLKSIKGIGTVKAVQIKCIGELAKRLTKSLRFQRISFVSAKSIAQYFMEDMRHKKTECLIAMYLDSNCGYIGESEISKGTVNASIASPREIFIEALIRDAVNIIILHNHPSGNPRPSNDDIEITNRIVNAGEIIGIDLLDHIIIGDNTYYSFKENNLI